MIGNDWDEKLKVIWDSEGFKKFYQLVEDEYQNKIKDAIDLKIEGKNIKKPKKKRETNIKDLMTALEMSLKNV